MSLFVDSSALLKRYVDEPAPARPMPHVASDASLLTGRHTITKVRRSLARLLDERDAIAAKAAFRKHITAFGIVELDSERPLASMKSWCPGSIQASGMAARSS